MQARPRPRMISSDRGLSCVFIGANGLSWNQASLYWDRVTLTDLDDEILTALQIIAPGVMGLSFVGEAETTSNRVPLVRVKDIDEPLPLGSLGNGMLRILGIVLALANAKDGILLVDEIENGIHYSAQQEVWQMIFSLAPKLNVQVFATTHSWDCIEGFQKAAIGNKQQVGNKQGEGRYG
ncbi:MAG: AAA family ATPase [Ktedonobacteraceae bacterium]